MSWPVFTILGYGHLNHSYSGPLFRKTRALPTHYYYYLVYDENMTEEKERICTINVIIYKISTGVWQWPYNSMSNSTIQVIYSGIALCKQCQSKLAKYV